MFEIQELRKKYICQFMNLMLGHNQQQDLRNLQILNLQPKKLFYVAKTRENSNDEFKIVKQHICLDDNNLFLKILDP